MDPCFDSSLDQFTIDDMSNSVQGTASVVNIKSRYPADTVSKNLGNGDGFAYCGERQFRIVSTCHEDFLSYNDLTQDLTLLSVSNNDIGSITVTIEAFLESYPSVRRSTTLTVEVTECEVLSLQAVPTAN